MAADGGLSARKPTGPTFNRHSSGLDQFFSSLAGRTGLSILDFGGASQANISFITELGYRLTSEDYVRSLDLAFGDGDQFYENQADPDRLQGFLHENLDFPRESFDGALVWDALQFLSADLLHITVARLEQILRPGSSLLAFFHADEKVSQVPVHTYRIVDHKTLMLTPRGMRKRAEHFNNRALERLFHNFDLKFFLTRDSLREILARR